MLNLVSVMPVVLARARRTSASPGTYPCVQILWTCEKKLDTELISVSHSKQTKDVLARRIHQIELVTPVHDLRDDGVLPYALDGSSEFGGKRVGWLDVFGQLEGADLLGVLPVDRLDWVDADFVHGGHNGLRVGRIGFSKCQRKGGMKALNAPAQTRRDSYRPYTDRPAAPPSCTHSGG